MELPMLRLLALLYGIVGALLFNAVILYQVLFLANYVVPKDWREPIYSRTIANRYIPAIDAEVGGGRADLAVYTNLGLLAAFLIPHSLMARAGFKRAWTRIVPPPIERSTYVIISSLLLATVFWFWQPIPEMIWPLEGSFLAYTDSSPARTVFQVLYWAGWGLVALSMASLAPLDLMGLRQTWLYFRGRPYTPPPLRTPTLYRLVRHPMMLGLLIAFWSTPVMTLGHALYAVVMSVYVLAGILLEERDLAAAHGEGYLDYKRRTSMLLPLRWRRG
jgi:protein-S-isoprenylcysteine O-methyltransferase Ste14